VSDEGEKFTPGLRIGPKRPQHATRHHHDALFLDASCRHAMMRRLDHHTDPARMDNLIQRISDLRSHFLLDLQAPCLDIHDARQFADPNDALIRQIANMYAADYRRHVMFTMGADFNILEYHHFVVPVGLLKSLLQYSDGILAISGIKLLIGANDPVGRFQQSFAVGIIPGPLNQSPNGGARFVSAGSWTD